MKIRFTSDALKACARLEPIAPAPPVTRTVLPRKASEGSPMSNCHPVFAPHPVHGPSDANLGRDLRVVLQIPDRFGTVNRLRLRSEGLCVLVNNQGVVAAHGFQDEVRVGLDVPLPFGAASNVVDLPGDEVVHDVREGLTGVLNVVDDALVSLVNYVRLVVQSVVDEFGDEATVRRVVL